MPRKKRFIQAYSCHHVMLRGNGGNLIFHDDMDRHRFCFFLQKASEEHLFLTHAFCFMNNHVHLILEPTTIALSKGMHSLAGRYAQYFNCRYEQHGHLFQDRFRSILVEDGDGDYLRRLTRYIHLNPVRAGLVSTPNQYLWSSFNAYLNKEKITWLTIKRILQRFANTYEEAKQGFIEHTFKKVEAEIDLDLIRQSNQIGAYGSAEFMDEFDNKDQFEFSEEQLMNLQNLMNIAQKVFCFDEHEISSANRETRLVDLRSILALVVEKTPSLSIKQLVPYFNRDIRSIFRLALRAKESEKLQQEAEKFIKFISEVTS